MYYRDSLKHGALVLIIQPSLATYAQAPIWTLKAPLPVTGGSGRNAAMCMTVNNKIYAGGGYVLSGTDSKEFYVYNPATNVWTQKADLPSASNRSAGIAFSINGKGYMGLGAENYLGLSGETKLNDLWVYDTTLNTWTAKASLPDSGRSNSAWFVVNNKVYVIGGETDPSGLSSNDIWVYDPAADNWTAKANFPYGTITDAFAFAIGTKGYISCGDVNHAIVKKTYEYDPVADSWTPRSDYPGAATRGGVSFTLNNKGYCGTGTPDFSNYSDTFYAFNAAANSWGSPITNFPGGARAFGIAGVVGTTAYVGNGWKVNTGSGVETFYSDWYKMVDPSTGVSVPGSDNTFSCFPNPTTGKLNIHVSLTPPGEPIKCNVYDLTGQIVYSSEIKDTDLIDLGNLPGGTYTLEVLCAGAIMTKVISLAKMN